MVKKIGLITLFVLFAGILIYGAVNRTTAKSETADRIAVQNQAADEHNISGNELEPQSNQDSFGQGNQGQGNQGQSSQGQGAGNGRSQGNNGQGIQGQGNQDQGSQGQGVGNGQGQGRNQQRVAAEIQQQFTIQGVVVQAPAYGVDMILETADGDILIGTGPGYLAEQDFVIVTGDSISVSGIWEDEEFKGAEITRLDDGSSIILRDEWGRPMWSGAGRNAQNRQSDQ